MEGFLGARGTAQCLTTADWLIDQPRYYALDYDGGSDTNLGYSDVSMSAAGTVALKTYEEFYSRLPPNGRDRKFVLGIKPRTGGATYLKKDGVTVDDVVVAGWNGYFRSLIRATADFSNTATDKVDLGATTVITGPNVDGSWTVAGLVGWTVQVAGGLLPTTDNIYGRKIRWKGNVTPGLRNIASMIRNGVDATHFDLGYKSTAPAVGDQFFIEEISVAFGGFVSGPARNAAASPSGVLRGLQVAGLKFVTPNTICNQGEGYSLQFCEFADNTGIRILSSGSNSSVSYMDETGTAIAVQVGTRFPARGQFTVVGGAIGQNINLVVCLDDLYIELAPSSIQLLAGSYVRNLLDVRQFGRGYSTANSISSAIGNAGSTAFNKLRVDGASHAGASFSSCWGLLDGVEANSAVGVGIDFYGDCRLMLKNVSGTPTGAVPGVRCNNGDGCQNAVFFIGSGNTLSGGVNGDFAMFGRTFTWAELTAEGFSDQHGNLTMCATAIGAPVAKLTPGTFARAQILGADPLVVAAGDVWFTDIAGTRSVCVRIGGVTYRTALTP